MSQPPQWWIAFMKLTAINDDTWAGMMTPHNVQHPGPLERRHWLTNVPPELGSWVVNQDWAERRYRISDDMADILGHKFIVVQMGPHPVGSSWFHFYKWQTRGIVAVMVGDEEGRNYPLRADKLYSICNWITDQQDDWCRRFHHDHDKGHEHACDEEVPTNFHQLSDLIARIAEKVGKPPKNG